MELLNKKIIFGIITILIMPLTLFSDNSNHENIVPRKIVVLYKKTKDITAINFTTAHRFAEMPLNYLGLIAEYHELSDMLPDIAERKDIRGVLTWFSDDVKIKNQAEYLNWATKVINSGKKYVIIGNPGFIESGNDGNSNIVLVKRFFRKLGLDYADSWQDATYKVKLIEADKNLLHFEKEYPIRKPSFYILDKADNSIKIYLKARIPGQLLDAVLICSSPNGGYVAEGYAAFIDNESFNQGISSLKWYINPFRFFAEVYKTQDIPAPDVTTIAGRRIYISHIDGDGWINYTKLAKYRNKPVYSSKIILDEAIKPYPELPVSIGPIMAELDLNERGTKESQEIAKEFFNLPNVEIASHTFTHPLDWGYFKDYSPHKRVTESGFLNFHKQTNTGVNDYYDKEETPYLVPRSYNQYPFNFVKEIYGSKEFIEMLINNGKKCKVLFWSGNCLPFEKAVYLSRKDGMRNINGGDSRFDNQYPSYLWVCPVGLQVGNQRQIYSPSSNENTYTDLWSKNYFAFKYLVKTTKNTENPLRVKPMSIYYHMYSGEYEASVNALKYNFGYAMQSSICPIFTSTYCSIADGFYSTEIFKSGDNSWEFANRDGLETIRFPKALFKAVDFIKSNGVIGQIHLQGSLYVYLDSDCKNALVTLKHNDKYWTNPKASQPYLIESRWRVFNLQRKKTSFNFSTQGFGKGKMSWYVPKDGLYKIDVNNGKETYEISSKAGCLRFTINESAVTGLNITIEKR